MKIVVPSYKRPNRVITQELLPSCIVVVPNSQVEEYEKAGVSNVVGIDDKLDGNIAKKRNAILNMYQGEDILFLDDDVSRLGYHENKEYHFVKEREFIDRIENMFQMTKELGTVLFGFNVQSDPKFYRDYSPFSLSSVVLGPLFGIVNIDDTIRYDERLFLKEDYDLCLQVLNKYRKILRNNKWFYICEHKSEKGGCTAQRNLVREEQQMKLLVDKWGSKIIKSDRKTQHGNATINPVVRVPIKGI